jgi:hypothetical protein
MENQSRRERWGGVGWGGVSRKMGLVVGCLQVLPSYRVRPSQRVMGLWAGIMCGSCQGVVES